MELSQCALPGTRANVLVVRGLPWYASEAQVAKHLCQAYPQAEPVTTRLYEDPVNGVSRGLCFVEYPAAASASTSVNGAEAAVDLEAVKAALENAPWERQLPLTASLYFLTTTSTRWDRAGRLPELPGDPPPVRRGEQIGFGSGGFRVRCGPALGLPNTVTPNGASKLRALRKRLRAKVAQRAGSSSSSSSSSDDDAEDE